MAALQRSYWHYSDILVPPRKIQAISEELFYSSLLYYIASLGTDPFHSPSFYTSEWEVWLRFGMVGGATIVRQGPNGLEVLMVKCYKPQFSELSSTFPGGKADPTDKTLWDVMVREVQEEIQLDISTDRSSVVYVIQNKRVFNAVFVVDYHDERFSKLKMKAFEIKEIAWAPVFLDLSKIKPPAKLQHVSTFEDGVVRNKSNPKEFRMPRDFQGSYSILQSIASSGQLFASPAENVEYLLNMSPLQYQIDTAIPISLEKKAKALKSSFRNKR